MNKKNAICRNCGNRCFRTKIRLKSAYVTNFEKNNQDNNFEKNIFRNLEISLDKIE